MIDAVSSLIRQAAAEIILPRWRQLAPEDVAEKSPGDLVTIADQEAEHFLTAGLQAIDPAIPVIGEEAVAARPALMDTLRDLQEFWVVDPIDGTQNFVHGQDRFAVMIARVRNGKTVASWIYLPVHNKLAVAEHGAGSWLNGQRISTPIPPENLSALVPAAHLKRLAEPLRSDVKSRLTQFSKNEPAFCAGYDYMALLEGKRHFLLYNRTLPWDHAPGTFLIEQAGGKVARFDGSPYDVTAQDKLGLLDAASADSWQQIHRALFS